MASKRTIDISMSADYLNCANVPKILMKRFDSVLSSELEKLNNELKDEPSQKSQPQDLINFEETEDFFKKLTGVKSNAPVNKNLLLKTQRMNSFNNSNSSSPNAAKVDEFPIDELISDAKLVNLEAAKVRTVIGNMEQAQENKEIIKNSISTLGDSLNKWNEKSQLLAKKCGRKTKEKPQKQTIKENIPEMIKEITLITDNSRAKKALEICFAENLPEKESDAKPIKMIESALNELIK